MIFLIKYNFWSFYYLKKNTGKFHKYQMDCIVRILQKSHELNLGQGLKKICLDT
jgi:hypothetical protein